MATTTFVCSPIVSFREIEALRDNGPYTADAIARWVITLAKSRARVGWNMQNPKLAIRGCLEWGIMFEATP